MAAGMKARFDKTSTSVSTLPIGCQICLDKVKQPVLCSNNHVFCSACMDVWLKKNNHCPACRTSINPSNPIKQIKGGMEHYENDKTSNAALRKSRFDLLYKEYEDEFDKLRSESSLLKAENDILKARLRTFIGAGSDQLAKDAIKPVSTADSNKLMIMTKKLEDTQKWNAKLKDESTRLKQENNRLKDENVYLSRENEKLKMELSGRSPQKFGRITVATLESQVEKYQKEIKQLNKALERSDQIIAELKMSKSGETSRTSIDLASRDKSDSRSRYGEVDVTVAKKQLFGYDGSVKRSSTSSTDSVVSISETEYSALPHLGSFMKSLAEIDKKQNRDKEVSRMKAAEEQNGSTSPSKVAKKVSFSLPSNEKLLDEAHLSAYSEKKNTDAAASANRPYGSVLSTSLKDSGKSKAILKSNFTNNNTDFSEPDFTRNTLKYRDHGLNLDLSDCGLDDTQTIQSELDDLNISLTPELSDCMKLLNRAEKKVHCQDITDIGSSNLKGNTPSSSSSSHDPLSNVPCSSVSSSDHYSLDRVMQHNRNTDPLYSSSTSHISGYSSSSKHAPSVISHSGDSAKGWQHEYYREMDDNPYGGSSSHSLYGDVDRSNYRSDLASSYSGHSYNQKSISKPHKQVEFENGTSNLDEKLHQLGIANNSKGKEILLASSANLRDDHKPPKSTETLLNSSFRSSSNSGNSKSYLNHDPLTSSYLYSSGVKGLSSSLKTDKKYSSLTDIPAAAYSIHSDAPRQSVPRGSIYTDLPNTVIRKYSSLTSLPTDHTTAPTFLAHSPISSSYLVPSDYVPTLSASHSFKQNSLPTSLSNLSKVLPLSSKTNDLFLSSHMRLPSSATSNYDFSASSSGAAPSSLPSSYAAAAASLRTTQSSGSDSTRPYSSVFSSSVGASSNTFTSSQSSARPAHSSYTNPLASAYAGSSVYLPHRDEMDVPKSPDNFGLDRPGNYSYTSDTSNLELPSTNSDSFLGEPKKRLFDSSDDFDLSMSPIKATRML